MATLTLRSVKGSPLTNSEVDGNFTALNTELGTKLDSASYTAADILTKIKTVDGHGSGLDADFLDGHTYSHYTPGAFVISSVSRTSAVATVVTASAHGFSVGQTVKVFGVLINGSNVSFNGTYTIATVPNTTSFTYSQPSLPNITSTVQADKAQCYVAVTDESIPDRDSTGVITAAGFVGLNVYANLVGNVTGNLTGDVTGNATNVSGTVAIANGGTGGTDAATARSNLGLGSLALQASNSVNITGGTITTLTTDIAIADGGTGASNAAGARTNLGLAIGTDVQAFDGDLSAIAGIAATSGIYVKTANNSAAARTLTGTTGYITVTNGDGASGNPTITVGTKVVKTDTYNEFTTTDAIKLPTGTDAQQPGQAGVTAAAAGQLRFNTTTAKFEGYNGSAWGSIGGGAVGGGGQGTFYENDQVVASDYTITSGRNAMSAGPITINDNITVTIPDGSSWAIV